MGRQFVASASPANGRLSAMMPNGLAMMSARNPFAHASLKSQTTMAALLLALVWVPGMRAQMPPLAGIAHMAFRIGDLEKSRDFYGKLGFEQAFTFDDAGKITVAFIKINDHQFIELYPRTDGSQKLGFMHFCFETEDIAAAHDVYAKRQLNPTEVSKTRAGNLLFALHDPEGQVLEYIQYLPGSPHWLDHGKHLSER